MTLSLSFLGLLALALFLLLEGYNRVFDGSVSPKLVGFFALVAGVFILLGLFVTSNFALS